MSWWEALVLGVLQGFTEFLPVSSSGHLEIAQALLGTAGEENLAFAVVVHTATVLSTLVVLWKEVACLFRGTFCTLRWNKEKDYVAKILLSMVPVFIVGVFLKDTVESFFGRGLLLVGICLIVTAILLCLSGFLSKRTLSEGHEVTFLNAFVIGCAQAVAVLPGLSRSGTTIATGLLCGVKKESVAQFSFLMVLVPILGESCLSLLDVFLGNMPMPVIGWEALLVGFIAAFGTGCLACRFMIGIVRRQKLVYFALYCLCIGVFAIVYGLC